MGLRIPKSRTKEDISAVEPTIFLSYQVFDEKAKEKILYSRKDKYSIKHVYYCHCEGAKGSRGNLRIMEFTLREKTEIASLLRNDVLH